MAAPHSSLPGHPSLIHGLASALWPATAEFEMTPLLPESVCMFQTSQEQGKAAVLSVERWQITLPKQLRIVGPHSQIQF